MNRTKAKKTRMKNTMRLIASMRPYRAEMVLTIVSTFLKHASGIAASGIAAFMAALAMSGGLRENRHALFAALCVCIVLKAVMFYGEMWFGHDVAYKVLKDFRVRLYAKIESISPAYMLKRHSGSIGATLMGDVELLEWFLAHTFGAAVVSVVITVLLLAALAYIHPALSALMLVFSALIFATPFVFKSRADGQGRAVRENLSRAASVTIEGIQGLRDILTLNFAARYKRKNSGAMGRLYASQTDYSRRNGTETGLMQVLAGAFTVAVMAIAAALVGSGRIGFELYPAAVLLSALIFSPIIEVCGAARNLGLVFAAANRVQAVFDEEPAVPPVPAASGTSRKPASASISFEDVTFSYTGAVNALSRVSFSVAPGETVALAGPSGAGKSTCVSLLLRCMDPSGGSVKIGGADIRELTEDTLRSAVCAVLQDVYLFNASIRENIRLGKPDASDAEVEAAAREADAHEFIAGLPDGYGTVTGERGFRLSGGQRQRVAIARAVLRNTPILLLDEAVSSLDAESEAFIARAIRGRLAGRTILLAAHRLSTIMSADRIVVLNEGRVIATGPHAELLSTSAFYRELIAAQ
jgi:ABC-type multidrug transport system fused ATPase/permease subunit